IESEREFTLAKVNFKLRLDRIDKTNQNDIIIIDYKTGKFNIADLSGERPKAPQLPLYYLATSDLQPTAVMVVKLNSQGCEYEGISFKETAITGVSAFPDQWETFSSQWHDTLGNLAQDFYQGKAAVDPLEGAATCRYCHLQAFCRIYEQRGANDE
ncbi:MAG: PD-(D/E)XK nuclease family protein, partial [Candidatus Berkiellales bacterium]